MSNYLADIRAAIVAEVAARCPGWDIAATPVLLDNYVLLVRAVGERVTRSDIHDAWSIWSEATHGPDHPLGYLVPFEQLPPDIQAQDEIGRAAVAAVARAARLAAALATPTPTPRRRP